MKDLVDHIRTVHFTVFVVALVLTIAVQGRRKPQLDRAASDAEAILLLQEKWPAVTHAFATALDSAVKHYVSVFSSDNGTRLLDVDEPGMYAVIGHSVYPNRPLTFVVPRRWMYVDETKVDENPGWGESEEFINRLPESWKTLKEFREFWDGHHDGRRGFVGFALATSNSAKSCGDVKKIPDRSTQTAFLVSHAYFDKDWKLAFTLEAMDRDPNVHKFACSFAPVSVSRWSGDVGAVLGSVAPEAQKWGNARSDDEFQDLLAETKYLEDLPVDKLAGAIRERANAEPDRIELFQARIPVEAISTYGALVLVICQLYLLAHLLELGRIARTIDRRDWPSGYIGLYENRVLSAFTFVSLVAWPPFPLLLFAHNASGRLALISALSALIVSITVAAASALALGKVRKSPASVPDRPRSLNIESRRDQTLV